MFFQPTADFTSRHPNLKCPQLTGNFVSLQARTERGCLFRNKFILLRLTFTISSQLRGVLRVCLIAFPASCGCHPKNVVLPSILPFRKLARTMNPSENRKQPVKPEGRALPSSPTVMSSAVGWKGPAAERKFPRSRLAIGPHLTGTGLRSRMAQRPQWAGYLPAVGWKIAAVKWLFWRALPPPKGLRLLYSS